MESVAAARWLGMRSIALVLTSIALVTGSIAGPGASQAAGTVPIAERGGGGEADLLNMIVQVEGEFEGYGLVVGESSGTIYIVTAGHVIGSNTDAPEVRVGRHHDRVVAKVIAGPTDRAKDDLALLEIAAGAVFRLGAICVARAASERDSMPVWFYGRDWKSSSSTGEYRTRMGHFHTAAGLREVEDGDSGSTVYGQTGILGILSSFTSSPSVGAGNNIHYTDIHRVKAFVEEAKPRAWALPDCDLTPIWGKHPRECEAQGSRRCWINAAVDVFRADPIDFVPDRLVRALARFGTQQEVSDILQRSGGVPDRHTALLLEAADAAVNQNSAINFATLAMAQIVAIGPDDLPHVARAAAAYGRHGDAVAGRALLDRSIAAVEDFPQRAKPLAYLQLAYYASDLGDEALQESLARRAADALRTLSREDISDLSVEMGRWLMRVSYSAARSLPPDLLAARFRSAAFLREGDSWATQKVASFRYFVKPAAESMIERYAWQGAGLAAAQAMKSAYAWWDTSEHGGSLGYRFALDALIAARDYDGAQRLIDESVTDAEDSEPIMQFGGRTRWEAARDLFELAKSILYQESDAPWRARKYFLSAQEFSQRHSIEYDAPELAQHTCKADLPEVALRFYVDALSKDLADRIKILSMFSSILLTPGSTFDSDDHFNDPDFVASNQHAELLGIEIPLCIAEAAYYQGQIDTADKFTEFVRARVTNGRIGVDRRIVEEQKRNFDRLKLVEQAEVLLRELTTRAPRFFDEIDWATGRYSYGRTLLRMAKVDLARETMDAEQWALVGRWYKHDIFSAYVGAGRMDEARAYFLEHEPRIAGGYRSHASDAESKFLFQAAVELARHGRAGSVADFYSRLSEPDASIIRSDLMRHYEQRGRTPDAFERLVEPLLAIDQPRKWAAYWQAAWHFTELGDAVRAAGMYRKAMEIAPKDDRHDRVPDLIRLIRLKLADQDYNGMADVILLTRSAEQMADLLLEVAGIP